jgi:hypothetical protein
MVVGENDIAKLAQELRRGGAGGSRQSADAVRPKAQQAGRSTGGSGSAASVIRAKLRQGPEAPVAVAGPSSSVAGSIQDMVMWLRCRCTSSNDSKPWNL